jgi:hypothetical protein
MRKIFTKNLLDLLLMRSFFQYEEKFPLIGRKVFSDMKKGFLLYEEKFSMIRGYVSSDMRKGFL